MKRVKLQPAFILHTRPYRDTSLLVELLTFSYGRISAVARSARGLRSRFKGLLRPFVPILVSWSGSTDLVYLAEAEVSSMPYDLAGDALLSGFYLNELVVRLLHVHDAHPEIYNAYEQTLWRLQQQPAVAIALRLFEKQLLMALGYGLPLQREALTGRAIDPAAYYQFNPNLGFIKSSALPQPDVPTFYGEHLLALAAEQLDGDAVLIAAKRLMRLALQPLLSERPIKSRELFYT